MLGENDILLFSCNIKIDEILLWKIISISLYVNWSS
jgi:hypothetical protein